MAWWIWMALVAQAGSLSCTSGEQDPAVVYSSWGKSGGARPGPETVVASESWAIDGEVIFRSEKLYLGEKTETGDLEWGWLEDKTRDVEVLESNQVRKRVRYVAEVRLSRPSGAELPGKRGPTWTGTLTCVREERFGTP